MNDTKMSQDKDRGSRLPQDDLFDMLIAECLEHLRETMREERWIELRPQAFC